MEESQILPSGASEPAQRIQNAVLDARSRIAAQMGGLFGDPNLRDPLYMRGPLNYFDRNILGSSIRGSPMNPVVVKDNIESAIFVPSDTPEDDNVGRSNAMKFFSAAYSAKFGFRSKVNTPVKKHKTTIPHQHAPEDLLVAELCKINNLENYMEACDKFKEGKRAGWTDVQLFNMIAEMRSRESEMNYEDILDI